MGTPPICNFQRDARLLLVEDDPLLAADVKSIVEELGFTLAGIALSGAEALELASQQRIHLVLMNIRIKGEMDAVHIADKLRHSYGIPIVYMATLADGASLQPAVSASRFGHITVPVTAGAVKAAVAVAIAHCRRQRQAQASEATLHSALVDMGEGIVISNAAGLVSFINRAGGQAIGIHRDAAYGTELDAFVRVLNDNGSVHSLQSLALENGGHAPRCLTGMLLRRDGSEGRVLLSVGAIGGDVGLGIVAVLRDISPAQKPKRELCEARSILSRTNRQLTLLSHSLMHDLKDPLHPSVVYPRQDGLRDARAKCERLNQLVRTVGEYWLNGFAAVLPQPIGPRQQGRKRASLPQASGRL